MTFATHPERHTGRSLRLRWLVVPFNCTGCIWNAAGGQIAAPTATYNAFCILRTKNKDRNVKNAVLWNKFGCRVVLCAESQNQLIASGNHTFIPSADLPPLQPFVHQYTQCSGDDPSPSNVENTTCADERNHLPTCHPEGANASRGIYPSGKL